MSPPKDDASVSCETVVIGAGDGKVPSGSAGYQADGPQDFVGRRRRRREDPRSGGSWRGRGRAPLAPRAPAGPRSEDHGDAAVLGLVPMVGKGETFHYLLSLDSSVLDRGREVRQLKISVRPGLTNEPNPGAHPVTGAIGVCGPPLRLGIGPNRARRLPKWGIRSRNRREREGEEGGRDEAGSRNEPGTKGLDRWSQVVSGSDGGKGRAAGRAVTRRSPGDRQGRVAGRRRVCGLRRAGAAADVQLDRAEGPLVPLDRHARAPSGAAWPCRSS